MKDSESSAPVMGKFIAGALLKAQVAIDAVGKTSRNDFGKYDYASSEHVVSECRRVLSEAGLLVTAGPGSRHVAEIAEQNGGDWIVASAKFLVVHPESGEYAEYDYELPAVSGKGRPLDKAVLGAWTTALGYFLRDLLLIPRLDENEIDNRDDATLTPKVLGARGPEIVSQLEAAGRPFADLLESMQRRYPDCGDNPAEWPSTFESSLLASLRKIKSESE